MHLHENGIAENLEILIWTEVTIFELALSMILICNIIGYVLPSRMTECI